MPDALVTQISELGLAPLVVIFVLLVVYLILGSIFDTVAAMILFPVLSLWLPAVLGYNIDVGG